MTLPQVAAEAWRMISRAAVDRKHPCRFVVMATAAEAAPGLRYVVLRAIEEGDLLIYTDARSQKLSELRKQPETSLLFYHPGYRCQVKVMGETKIHRGDVLSERHWSKVQGETRKAYGSVLPPGAAIDSPEAAYDWPAEIDSEHFAVLRVQPEHMEVLQLNGLSHLRARFEYHDEQWRGTWLVP